MSFIERVLRRIPYLRRPYFQRDAARAEIEALTSRLLGVDTHSPDARTFFPNEWHFILPSDDARQDESLGAFRPYIRGAVTKTKRALEIGPSLSPVLAKAEGYNVAVLDHTDQPGLIAKYARGGLDTSAIEAVDFVWQGGPMTDLLKNTKYDAIVACHVIEHAPDFVGFLADCSASLTAGGSIYLIVPDKRYCFDFFQPLSDVAKVRADHRAGRDRHSFESFYRLGASVAGDGATTWSQRGVASFRFLHGDPNFIRQVADGSAGSEGYEDTHENVFTPMSFMMLIDELRYLGELDLTISMLSRSRGCEFLAVLRKSGASDAISAGDFMARKLCAYRVLMVEEMERIHSYRP
jgi:hypothetical protein